MVSGARLTHRIRRSPSAFGLEGLGPMSRSLWPYFSMLTRSKEAYQVAHSRFQMIDLLDTPLPHSETWHPVLVVGNLSSTRLQRLSVPKVSGCGVARSTVDLPL